MVANNTFAVGDGVVYTTLNTALTGLSNNTTYYVEFANATHFALASTLGGYRIAVGHTSSSPSVQTFTEANINTVSTVVTASTFDGNVPFAPGSHITLYPSGTHSMQVVSVNVST